MKFEQIAIVLHYMI